MQDRFQLKGRWGRKERKRKKKQNKKTIDERVGITIKNDNSFSPRNF